MTINPFVFVESASFSKKDLMRELPENEYLPYLTNKAFSFHIDSIFEAQDMNMYPDLDKKLQYHYYLYGLRAKKRYGKWPKPEVLEDIELIKKIFNCNDIRANEYLSLIDKDNLNRMKEQLPRSK